MFPANAEFEVGAGGASALHRDRNQFAHPVAIQGDEGVLLQNPLIAVAFEEIARVVARQAESGLGQVVGAEAEEFGGLGDIPGAQGGTRQLDHGADEISHRLARLLHHLARHAVDHGL